MTSTYSMASLHGKHSKQLNLPLGDRWGVPVGTSVADCLNWTIPVPKPKEYTSYTSRPQIKPELVLEETTSNEVYVNPPIVDDIPEVTPVPSPIKRVPAPTPKGMNPSAHGAPTPRRSQTPGLKIDSGFDDMVVTGRETYRDRAQTPSGFRNGYKHATPAPPPVTTQRYVSHGNRVTVQERAETPPSFRQNYEVKSKKKSRATPEPMTFREFTQQGRGPSNTGRMISPQKFGNYPHYEAAPSRDDVEYIMKQTKSLRVRTPTPGRTSRNGYKANLLVPRSTNDDLKEQAMIQAIRQELHSSHNEALEPVTEYSPARFCYDNPGVPPSVNSRALARSNSARPGSVSRLEAASRNSQRPRSSTQMELVNKKKTVNFMNENEYFRYLEYLEDRYGEGASRSPSNHFNAWRDTTGRIATGTKKRVTPTRKNVQQYRGRKTPGAESPGKVNVEMDCPENADMTISVRVRNTQTVTAY